VLIFDWMDVLACPNRFLTGCTRLAGTGDKTYFPNLRVMKIFLTGFVSSLSRAPSHHRWMGSHLFHPSQHGLSVSMAAAKAPLTMMDYSSTAIQFFMSERVTAALIAGASLTSLFSMSKLAREVGSSKKDHSILVWALTRFYHGLCLISVLLTLNVVVTSTCASSILMLEKCNGLAGSAYEFLMREMRYEFITTQWSLLVGLLAFLMSIGIRTLLEFDLLKKEKRSLACFVVLSISSLLTHLISYVNSTLHEWPNILGESFLFVLGTCVYTIGLATYHKLFLHLNF
jgi:hypothetical protein